MVYTDRTTLVKCLIISQEFKCSYCSKTFDRRDVLNDHIRNHTGEKPFECNICKKKFTRGFVLLRHMRTHGEGLYKCDFCHKGFDRKDTYRDHMRNHTGEKPFKCKFCGKAFSRWVPGYMLCGILNNQKTFLGHLF